MQYKKVNIKSEVEKRLKSDPELASAYNHAQNEYRVIKELVKIRNEKGFTQSAIAKESGLTQQMISRIETIDNSPTLRNLIKYIDSLGMEIKIEKKSNKVSY